MDDIRPLFFTTEVVAEPRRPQTQQLKTKLHKQKGPERMLSPHERLKRIKQEMQRSKQQYFKTLSETHRIQRSLTKVERKKHQTRNEFFKVYSNLKYKKYLEEINTQQQSKNRRLSQQKLDQTKKKKLEQELELMLSKNEEQEKIQFLQNKHKREKQRIAEIKEQKKNDIMNWTKSKHDMIKSQHTEFVIRKFNISTILQERSKLNYMKKVNKELSLLKQYENVIEEIGTFNIDGIKQTIDDEDKLKGYETFFMTTKNTIS